MAKKTSTPTDIGARLPSLLEQQASLEQQLAEARAQISTADLAVPGTSSRLMPVRESIKGLEDALIAIGPQISAAQQDLVAERLQEREDQLLALRAEEAGERQPVIDTCLELGERLARWRAFVLRMAALGGSPSVGVPGPLGYGLEVAWAYWGQTVPEAIGLPPKLTRIEQLKLDAVSDAEADIASWIAADARANEARNHNLKPALRRRADAMLPAIRRSQDRCRALGAKVPEMPGTLMGQFSTWLERLFAREAKEEELLHPVVSEDSEPHSPQMRALMLKDLRDQADSERA